MWFDLSRSRKIARVSSSRSSGGYTPAGETWPRASISTRIAADTPTLYDMFVAPGIQDWTSRRDGPNAMYRSMRRVAPLVPSIWTTWQPVASMTSPRAKRRGTSAVVIAGVAGLVAGAVSMGASNYVSVKAEQEVDASQRRLQRQAIDVAPETKRNELIRIYEAKGLTRAEAESVAARISERPEEFLKALLAEEQAAPQDSAEGPAMQAAYTAFAFAGAGVVPILPFLALPAIEAVLASVVLTGVALFIAGVVRALSTLNPFLRSGLEMVLIGMGAAAATYLVGLALGVIVD